MFVGSIPATRALLQVVARLCATGPLSIARLTAGSGVSRQAVSKHLRVLEEAGLVQAQEEGTRNIYSLRMHGFASVQEFVGDFWDTALAVKITMTRSVSAGAPGDTDCYGAQQHAPLLEFQVARSRA